MNTEDGKDVAVSTDDGNAPIEQQQQQPDKDPATTTTTAPEDAPTAAAAEEESANSSHESAAAPIVSKNQQKKRRRLERMLAVKARRKQQEKEATAARAAAAGRDLHAERAAAAAREATGEGKRRRAARWHLHTQRAVEQNFQVCVDCAYEADMTSREICSLAQQIRYCYATNRRSDLPTLLAATSLSGKTRQHLERVSGFDEWQTRAFTCTEQPLEEYYRSHKADLVYLTSDSDNVLQELDKTKIYIIGGIVDRNRLKRAALTRAETLQITTAKLPLEEHLKKMESTRVLTCNHVFDILMHYSQHKSWEKALISVLPPRKGAQLAAASHEAASTEAQPDMKESETTEHVEGAQEEKVSEEKKSS